MFDKALYALRKCTLELQKELYQFEQRRSRISLPLYNKGTNLDEKALNNEIKKYTRMINYVCKDIQETTLATEILMKWRDNKLKESGE